MPSRNPEFGCNVDDLTPLSNEPAWVRHCVEPEQRLLPPHVRAIYSFSKQSDSLSTNANKFYNRERPAVVRSIREVEAFIRVTLSSL